MSEENIAPHPDRQLEELRLQNELLSKENEILKSHLQEYFQAREVITRQDARRRLLESEIRYRSLVEGSPDIIAIFNEEDRLAYVNMAGYRYLGAQSAEDLIGKPRVEFLLPEDAEDFFRVKKEFMNSEINYYLTFRKLPDAEGNAKQFEILTIKTTYHGKPAVQLIARCIDERIKMQMELEESEKRFRTIFEGSPVGQGIYIGNIVYLANNAYARIFGYDSPQELVGKDSTEFVCAGIREKVGRELAGRIPGKWKKSSYDITGMKRDGKEFPLHVEAEAIELNGKPATIGYIVDMTETQKKEEEIIASLHEKEIMLKEIHHRVKNNLQIISSLLSLQIDLVTDKNYMDAFQESRDRVKTMAIIHEKLYQSGDFAAIDFRSYTEDLVQYLLKTSYINHQNIKLDLQLDDIKLDVDNAIPCALAVNELISNAFKHAFPGGRSGNIILTMKKEEKNVVVSVKDDGIGISDAVSLNDAGTLGITLINSLTGQLKGNVFVKTDLPGTEFTITFPAKGL